jgi:hypothetical protein
VPQIAPPDETAARDLAFGRAKERAGLAGRAAMRGLSHEATARGIEGSGIVGDRMAGIMGDVAGQQSEFATSQALDELRRVAAINDRNYQGGITQRGQDLDYANANASRQAERERYERMIEEQRRESLMDMLKNPTRGGRIY